MLLFFRRQMDGFRIRVHFYFSFKFVNRQPLFLSQLGQRRCH